MSKIRYIPKTLTEYENIIKSDLFDPKTGFRFYSYDKKYKVVAAENLSSYENYIDEDNEVTQVLKNISFEVGSGEIWGVIGDNIFGVSLLLEIISNIKPYYDGKCVLNEIGMVRRKRIILPHVFYIGKTDMLFKNMNVLEYLMFVTAKTDMNLLDRQESIIDLLVEVGMGHLTLVHVCYLTEEEKALVLLLTAYLCFGSTLIVMNLPQLEFEEKYIESFRKIAGYISIQNRSLIFSSNDCQLIETVADYTALLSKGRLAYTGPVTDLCMKCDRSLFSITIENPEKVCGILSKELPDFDCRVESEKIVISDKRGKPLQHADLYNLLISLNLKPESVEVTKKTIKRAYREGDVGFDI